MKKLILLGLLSFSFLTVSCESGADDVVTKQAEDTTAVTVMIKENYTSRGRTMEIPDDYLIPNDFFVNEFAITKPVMPSEKVRVHFVTKEATETYKVGDVVKSVDMNVGTNQLSGLPRLKYDVVVTNYTKFDTIVDEYGYEETKENTEWFKYANAIDSLPNLSDKIYLFSKSTVDFRTETVASVELKNAYSLIKILRNVLITDTQGNFVKFETDTPIIDNTNGIAEGEQFEMVDDNSNYFYMYTKGELTTFSFKYNVHGIRKGATIRDLGANNVYIFVCVNGFLFKKEVSFDDKIFK